MRYSRSTPRMHFEQEVTLQPREGTDAIVAHARNLSVGGIFVEAPRTLAVGSRARVAFELPDGSDVEAEATVVWSVPSEGESDPGMALRFDRISDEHRRRVETCLQQRIDVPRIRALTEAAQALLADTRDLPEADGTADEIGQLGAALRELGLHLQSTTDRLSRLMSLTQHINDGVTLDQILTHVYDSFRAALPYDRIGLSLLEDGGRTLRAVWARSTARTLEIQRGYVAPMAGSSLQTIIETGEPRIIGDLPGYLEQHPDSDATARIVAEGMLSSLTCPLVAQGRPIGFLFFSSTRRHAYESVHVEFFAQIASQLSAAIEKGRLYEDLLEAKSDLESANRRLERLVGEDALTGIANRREFDERLGRAWRRAIRNQSPVALMLVDVDHFKRFNDHYGHQAGDACLRNVARALDAALRRPGDFVARYGGEEFAAVLTQTESDGVLSRAEHVRRAIRALAIPHAASDVDACVTASVGVAWLVPERATMTSQLVELADAALYRAKERGRNRVELMQSG